MNGNKLYKCDKCEGSQPYGTALVKLESGVFARYCDPCFRAHCDHLLNKQMAHLLEEMVK